jgi:hypothetical protein
VISQGVLSLGNGGTTGSLPGPITVNAGGTLAVNRSNAFTLTNAISGTGDFAQIGPAIRPSTPRKPIKARQLSETGR